MLTETVCGAIIAEQEISPSFISIFIRLPFICGGTMSDAAMDI